MERLNGLWERFEGNVIRDTVYEETLNQKLLKGIRSRRKLCRFPVFVTEKGVCSGGGTTPQTRIKVKNG